MPVTATSSLLATGRVIDGLLASSAEMIDRIVSTPEGVSRMSQQGGGVRPAVQVMLEAEIQP